MVDEFERALSAADREVLAGLTDPVQIQAFLDGVAYSPENANRCPLRVLHDRLAHCLDGGLFAAAALRRLGFAPLIVDLLPEPGTDDDHVLAIFKVDGLYGAVAKSNFTGLRYRAPVYRSLRELTMSYFEDYFNVDGRRTLRGYAPPLNLATLDRYQWMTTDRGADVIEQRLLVRRCIPLINPAAGERLTSVDEISYRAGMLVANPAGLYKPKV